MSRFSLAGPWRTCLSTILISAIIAASVPATLADNMRTPSTLPSDVQLGLEVSVAISDAIGFNDDPEMVERINRIGNRIAAAAEEWEHPFSFNLLDIPEPNAMALPGGFLFVTTGMFDLDLTDDEMAHLIAHEMTHVRRDHHARAARLNTLISLAQTVLMMGILIGVPDTDSYGQRVAVHDDPGVRGWGVGVSGKQALLQGTSLLGGVMSALFDRGYSRKLEFEADEGGMFLAAKAGYDPAAGISMLQKLHDRSFEGHRFSYWRTHPYFDDRLARSRSRASRLVENTAVSQIDETMYRQQCSLYFAAAADQVYDESQADLLHRCALQAEPKTIASPETALEIIRLKVKREEAKHPLFRLYRPLVTDYDSLISKADQLEPTWPNIEFAKRERETLETRLGGLLTDYLDILDTEEYSTDFLRMFISNYPEHERSSEMICLLSENYLLSDEPTEAIDLLSEFLLKEDSGAWADSAQHLMIDAIADLDNPLVCTQLLNHQSDNATEPTGSFDNDEIAIAARNRMNQILEDEISMKIGSEFLQSYPDSEWSEPIREKVWEDARKSFEDGRVQEGLFNPQEALNIYFTILALAPDAPVSELAEASINRLHRLEELGDYK